MSKLEKDKGIVYSKRVLVGNWYEAAKLEEYKLNQFLQQMKKGDLMLARFRKMTENLNAPTILTQSTGSIAFGDRISILAPHVPASDPPIEGHNGVLLGGRVSSNEIAYSQELEDGSSVVTMPNLTPAERSTFVITSADYCDRKGEVLKYNQEFLLTLASSLKRKPLYIRYDPNPIPGLCGLFPLYLSEHYVSNTRWRVLPIRAPPENLTRFELEDKPITVNTDVIINHCATNMNLGVNVGSWVMGFYGKVGVISKLKVAADISTRHSSASIQAVLICPPLMKTCLDVYGKETANNVWQVHTPIQQHDEVAH